MEFKSLKKMRDNFLDNFEKKCDLFEEELRTKTPVDTGFMIKNWITINPTRGKRFIYNLADYAWVIARGRVFLNGRWYGSLKGWGRGGVKPLIRKYFID